MRMRIRSAPVFLLAHALTVEPLDAALAASGAPNATVASTPRRWAFRDDAQGARGVG
jgi:hypothetical protein